MRAVERRVYSRLPKQYVLRHKKFTIKDVGMRQALESRVKNVSAGGLLFESNEKYLLGEIIQLELEIPGWEKYKTEFYRQDQSSASQPIVIVATVVRLEQLASSGFYDIGVCFSGIDADHQVALTKFIDGALSSHGDKSV